MKAIKIIETNNLDPSQINNSLSTQKKEAPSWLGKTWRSLSAIDKGFITSIALGTIAGGVMLADGDPSEMLHALGAWVSTNMLAWAIASPNQSRVRQTLSFVALGTLVAQNSLFASEATNNSFGSSSFNGNETFGQPLYLPGGSSGLVPPGTDPFGGCTLSCQFICPGDGVAGGQDSLVSTISGGSSTLVGQAYFDSDIALRMCSEANAILTGQLTQKEHELQQTQQILQNSTAAFDRKKDELNTMIATLEKNLGEAESLQSGCLFAKGLFIEEMGKLREDITQLNNALEKTKIQLHTSDINLGTCNSGLQTCILDLNESAAASSLLSTDVVACRFGNDQLTTQNQNATRQISELSEQYDQCMRTITVLNDTLRNNNSTINSLQASLSRTKTELDQESIQRGKCQQQLETAKKSYEQEIDNLTVNISNLMNELAKSEQEKDTLQANFTSCENNFKSTTQNLTDCQSTLGNEIEAKGILQTQLAELKKAKEECITDKKLTFLHNKFAEIVRARENGEVFAGNQENYFLCLDHLKTCVCERESRPGEAEGCERLFRPFYRSEEMKSR